MRNTRTKRNRRMLKSSQTLEVQDLPSVKLKRNELKSQLKNFIIVKYLKKTKIVTTIDMT